MAGEADQNHEKKKKKKKNNNNNNKNLSKNNMCFEWKFETHNNNN